MTSGFRFTNRWPDMVEGSNRAGGLFGGVERELVDRMDQRDTELEDFLAGGSLETFSGTTTWDGANGEITVTVPTPSVGVMYQFKVTGGTPGEVYSVFTDSIGQTFPVDSEGGGGVTITLLTGKTEGGAQTIPVRRSGGGGVLALVGGVL